jgi:hypothetical protein
MYAEDYMEGVRKWICAHLPTDNRSQGTTHFPSFSPSCLDSLSPGAISALFDPIGKPLAGSLVGPERRARSGTKAVSMRTRFIRSGSWDEKTI